MVCNVYAGYVRMLHNTVNDQYTTLHYEGPTIQSMEFIDRNFCVPSLLLNKELTQITDFSFHYAEMNFFPRSHHRKAELLSQNIHFLCEEGNRGW